MGWLECAVVRGPLVLVPRGPPAVTDDAEVLKYLVVDHQHRWGSLLLNLLAR